MSHPKPEQETSMESSQGRHRYLWLGVLLGLMVLAFAAYWLWRTQVHTVSTHDAYVAGNIVQISPQVKGTVVAINADNTDFVQAGETLIKLDTTDAELSLQQAKANFFQTQRETKRLYANTQQLQALADVRQSELKQAMENLRRHKQLKDSGHISQEALENAEITVNVATDTFLAANQQLIGQQALTAGLSPANHPTVKKAEIEIRNKFLSYARTNVISPVSGYVEKRAVQIGQNVEPGQALMVVIPLDQLWVDANFKEVELKNIRIGQPVTLTADLYGDKVKFRGQVTGIGSGTGSVFALLPPQNATGNWIKVVQRVPVRISIASENLEQYPLRLGLSMEVEVDTRDRSGPLLNSHHRKEPTLQTSVYDRISKELDQYLIQFEMNSHRITEQDPTPIFQPRIDPVKNDTKNRQR